MYYILYTIYTVCCILYTAASTLLKEMGCHFHSLKDVGMPPSFSSGDGDGTSTLWKTWECHLHPLKEDGHSTPHVGMSRPFSLGDGGWQVNSLTDMGMPPPLPWFSLSLRRIYVGFSLQPARISARFPQDGVWIEAATCHPIRKGRCHPHLLQESQGATPISIKRAMAASPSP